jgi:hypothetical protein
MQNFPGLSLWESKGMIKRGKKQDVVSDMETPRGHIGHVILLPSH